MDPFFARNRLSAYVDRTLSDHEADAVASAISSDPELRAEYEQLRRSVEFVRSVGPTEAPAGFHARVMAAVASEPIPKGNLVFLRRFFGRVPVEAVALAAAAAVVVLVIQGRDAMQGLTHDLSVGRDAVADKGEDAVAAPPPAPPSSVGSSGAIATAPPAAELSESGQKKAMDADGGARELAAASKTNRLATEVRGTTGAGGKGGAETWMDWEQEAGGDLSSALAGASQGAAVDEKPVVGTAASVEVRMTLAQSSTLFDLSALAEQNNGRLVDSKGRSLTPRELTQEDNFARATLVVPVDRRATVETMLRKMGGSIRGSGSSSAYGADQAVFVVELNYQP